jgi:ABC-2 type transport system permease protein
MRTTALLLTEARFRWIYQKRYFFNYAASTLNLLLFIFFLRLGIGSFGSFVASDYLASRVAVLIIGLFTFTMIVSSITSVSNVISEGASTGTLEQMMLSPYGSCTLFLCKAAVGSSFSFIYYLLIVPITMLLCWNFFPLNIPMLAFLTLPLCMCSWGIGFIIGAATLVFKQASGFANLVQFLVLSLMVLPSYPFSPISLLPVAPQARTINLYFTGSFDLNPGWLIFLYAHGLAYLILGMTVFRLGEKHARKMGTLGQY